jgi:hypothetical protein
MKNVVQETLNEESTPDEAGKLGMKTRLVIE